MRTTTLQINQLILDQLAVREMRPLALVVAVRKALGTSTYYKGDLSVAVNAALRKMVFERAVVDEEGVYSLAQTKPTKAAVVYSSTTP